MAAFFAIVMVLVVHMRVNNCDSIDDMGMNKEIDVHVIAHKEQQHQRCYRMLKYVGPLSNHNTGAVHADTKPK